MDRRPVLWIDALALQATLAANKEMFLADLYLERRAVCAQFLAGDGANLLNRDVDLIVP